MSLPSVDWRIFSLDSEARHTVSLLLPPKACVEQNYRKRKRFHLFYSSFSIHLDFLGEKNDVIEPLVVAGALALDFLLDLTGLDLTVDAGRLDPACEAFVAVVLLAFGFSDGIVSFWLPVFPATLDMLSMCFSLPTGAKKDLTLLGFGIGLMESELRNLVELI